MDDPEALPPQGEFFCQDRASWMPEIPGKLGCEASIDRANDL